MQLELLLFYGKKEIHYYVVINLKHSILPDCLWLKKES